VPALLQTIGKQLQHQMILLTTSGAAFALLKFPLQHHFILSRFQHIGICMAVFALGYFLQTVWSWRSLTVIGRSCLLATGSFIGLFAWISYESPWLDARMAVQTEEQELLKLLYIFLFALLGSIIAIFWLAWILEKRIATKEGKHS
jgi:hypothetical protein